MNDRERIRMELWGRAYITVDSDRPSAKKYADVVLDSFDERFPPEPKQLTKYPSPGEYPWAFAPEWAVCAVTNDGGYCWWVDYDVSIEDDLWDFGNYHAVWRAGGLASPPPPGTPPRTGES